MTKSSHHFLKRFSLKAAMILTAASLFGAGETVWANEETSSVTTATTNASTPTELADQEAQLVAVTLLEASQQGLALHLETADENLITAREELDKAQADLEQTFANPSATDEEKVTAQAMYEFSLGFYEAAVEVQERYQAASAESDEALAAAEPEKLAFEAALEDMDAAAQLELYRLKRQVIENLMTEEETAYQALQDLADAAEQELETADLEALTFEEYLALNYQYGRATALASIAKLTYDYTELDAKIKALEEAVAKLAEKQPLLSSEQVEQVLSVVVKEKPVDTVTLDLPLAEMVSKVAGASTDDEINTIVRTYWLKATFETLPEIMKKMSDDIFTEFKLVKADYEARQDTPMTDQERLSLKLIYRTEEMYNIEAWHSASNYQIFKTIYDKETAETLSQFKDVPLSELTSEQEVALLAKIKLVLDELVATPVSTRREEALQDYRAALANPDSTEEDLLPLASRYGGTMGLTLTPKLVYQSDLLENRLAELTKQGGGEQSPGSTDQGQPSPGQNPTNQTDQADKPNTMGGVNSTEKLAKPAQHNQATTSDKAEITAVKSPVATSHSVATGQTNALPKTSEHSSQLLSALGLLSVVASAGLLVMKRQD